MGQQCCAGHRADPAEGVPAQAARNREGELREGLERFHALGLQATGPDGQKLFEAAYLILSSLLLGVFAQLPTTILKIDVVQEQEGSSDVVRMTVSFGHAPLVGEFAVRSRQPVDLCLAEKVTFTLERPPVHGYGDEPLVLRTTGVKLLALPEIVELRKRLAADLTEYGGMNAQAAGQWWIHNKTRQFPLETSKLRRLCDSFTDSVTISLPKYFQGKAFWGYLHAASRIVDAFEVYPEGSTGAAVTGRTRLLDPAEEHVGAAAAEMCHEMLRAHRPIAEKFAASTVNMGAFFEGRAVGQPGADPAKIAKLFSAASRWGPGDSSWHVHDKTWLIIDKKDAFGRVVEEQGRVLWHTSGGSVDAPVPPAAKPEGPLTASPMSKATGCSSMALILATTLAAVWTIAPVAAAAAGQIAESGSL